MADAAAAPPSGEPSTAPAAEPMPTDPAAADPAALKGLLAGSGGAEVAEALAREWRGDDFRANVIFATRTLAAFAGTAFGARLATETRHDDGPAHRIFRRQ